MVSVYQVGKVAGQSVKENACQTVRSKIGIGFRGWPAYLPPNDACLIYEKVASSGRISNHWCRVYRETQGIAVRVRNRRRISNDVAALCATRENIVNQIRCGGSGPGASQISQRGRESDSVNVLVAVFRHRDAPHVLNCGRFVGCHLRTQEVRDGDRGED
jgi:hypothetical protein